MPVPAVWIPWMIGAAVTSLCMAPFFVIGTRSLLPWACRYHNERRWMTDPVPDPATGQAIVYGLFLAIVFGFANVLAAFVDEVLRGVLGGWPHSPRRSIAGLLVWGTTPLPCAGFMMFVLPVTYLRALVIHLTMAAAIPAVFFLIAIFLVTFLLPALFLKLVS